MIITKGESHKGKSVATRRRYPNGCVIPLRELVDRINRTEHGRLEEVGAVMRAVVDATSTALDPVTYKFAGRLEPPAANLLRSLTQLNRCPTFQSVIQAILEAVEDGPRGIDAAYNTALEFLCWAFEARPSQEQLRSQYRRKLSTLFKGARVPEIFIRRESL